MKRILSVMSILSSIMLLGVACQEKGSETRELRISVKQGNIVSAPYDTTLYALAYTVTEAGSGKKAEDIAVKAVSEKDWVVVESVTEDVVNIKVIANYEPESRMSKLVLSCPDAEDLSMTITQKSNPDYRLDDNLDFSFSVEEASAWRIVCDIQPNTQKSYYHYDIMTRKQYDSFADSKALIDNLFFQMTQYRVTYMMTYGYDLPYTYFMSKGDQKVTKTGLDPETEYVVVAYAMSPAPSFGKSVFTKVIKTGKVPESSDTFQLSQVGGVVTIKPDNDSRTYLFLICDDTVWKKYSSPEAIAQDYIEDLGSDVAFSTRKGTTTIDYSKDLVDGNKYWVVAFGHLGTKINTGISYMSFEFKK